MRIFLMILMVLAVLASAGLGFMIGNENLVANKDEVAAAEKMLESLEKSEAGKEAAAELRTQLNGYKTSGYAGFALGGLAVLLMLSTFFKSNAGVSILAFLSVAASIAFVVMCPEFDTGATGPASPRLQAMLVGGATVLAAITAFGAEKIRQKRQFDFDEDDDLDLDLAA